MNDKQLAASVVNEVKKAVVGKDEMLIKALLAILSRGHILLEDFPGVGKTTLIKTLAAVSGCRSKRIQFVPDLLPADILGMNIYDRNRGEFRRLPGPVFTNLLLADEINRAVPRTQSALLEAMEERQVTIDGETLPLPTPFVVMATQNPAESESTFRLPAAQMDRVLIRLSMGYPAPEEERRMLFSLGDSIPLDGLETVTSPEELVAAQDSLSQIRVSPEVTGYLVSLVGATRSHPMGRMGASPRASRALFRAARAWAAMAVWIPPSPPSHPRGWGRPAVTAAMPIPTMANRQAMLRRRKRRTCPLAFCFFIGITLPYASILCTAVEVQHL